MMNTRKIQVHILGPNFSSEQFANKQGQASPDIERKAINVISHFLAMDCATICEIGHLELSKNDTQGCRDSMSCETASPSADRPNAMSNLVRGLVNKTGRIDQFLERNLSYRFVSDLVSAKKGFIKNQSTQAASQELWENEFAIPVIMTMIENSYLVAQKNEKAQIDIYFHSGDSKLINHCILYFKDNPGALLPNASVTFVLIEAKRYKKSEPIFGARGTQHANIQSCLVKLKDKALGYWRSLSCHELISIFPSKKEFETNRLPPEDDDKSQSPPNTPCTSPGKYLSSASLGNKREAKNSDDHLSSLPGSPTQNLMHVVRPQSPIAVATPQNQSLERATRWHLERFFSADSEAWTDTHDHDPTRLSDQERRPDSAHTSSEIQSNHEPSDQGRDAEQSDDDDGCSWCCCSVFTWRL